MRAFTKQVDGTHYVNQVIQPFELAYLVADGDAGFCKFVKYLSRDKGDRKTNLEKAIHITKLTAEIFEGYSKSFPEISPQSVRLIQAATDTLSPSFDPESENAQLMMLYILFLSNSFDICIEGIEDMIGDLDELP
jgi:hypothetical protein